MKQKIKVLFYLKRTEVKEDGSCPVMARLRVDQTSLVAFSTRLYVRAANWASGRMKGKGRAAEQINQQLDQIRSSAERALCELSNTRPYVTAEDVKCRLLGLASDDEMLVSYFCKFYTNFQERVGINRSASTAKSYHHTLVCISAFVKKTYRLSDIPFAALTRSFIEKFELHLRVKCRLGQGTIVLLISRLRTVICKAIDDGLLLCDPFMGYVCKRPKHVQRFLTRKELDKMMTTPLSTSRQYLVRDLFLFSCYTGISYSDMCKLTSHDLEVATDGVLWVKTKRVKTDVRFEVPLLNLPRQILDRYRGVASDDKLLPMYHNTIMNRTLKEIAEICGIERCLTFHTARHTYATEITLSQGVPIETVSRMLGHNQIKTTQLYAKITDTKIDNDMNKLERRLAGMFTYSI